MRPESRAAERKSDVSFSSAREKMKHRNLSAESLGPAKINIGQGACVPCKFPRKENNAVARRHGTYCTKTLERRIARRQVESDRDTTTALNHRVCQEECIVLSWRIDQRPIN